jgi:hypothetical protein
VTTTDLEAIRTDALAGPWKALALDEQDIPFDDETFADEMTHMHESGVADVTVLVGRASVLAHAECLAACAYDVLDLLYEWRDIEEPDEALARWEQAKAVAEALNARAGQAVLA